MRILTEKDLLPALVYADLFDYPLTEDELWQRLIYYSVNKKDFNKFVKKRKFSRLQTIQKYYFLKGKEQLISLRNKRYSFAQKKIKIASKVAEHLSVIPFVQFVGISGTLAVGNTDEDDDIDFFIITSNRLLWTTRFIVTLLVELTGFRRRPGQTKVKDKICLNMFLDEDHLSFTTEDQNLYTAYEIIQMKTLYDKNSLYCQLLVKNPWIKDYLPNAYSHQIKDCRKVISNKNNQKAFPGFILRTSEKILKHLQLQYMKKRKTKEIVTDGIIRFHPEDVKRKILDRFEKKLREYNI